jgi:hypothetical protein
MVLALVITFVLEFQKAAGHLHIRIGIFHLINQQEVHLKWFPPNFVICKVLETVTKPFRQTVRQ